MSDAPSSMPLDLESFEAFWPHYLGEHRSPSNRLLHYTGTSVALGLILTGLLTLQWKLLLLAPLLGYGSAWIGHFFIEKNKPASFNYAKWSFFGDVKMLHYFVTGKIGNELIRLYGSTHPDESAPLLQTSEG
jgi:hypothetical protein